MSSPHPFADRKLCVKARLTGALQVTMNMVKNNTTFFKVLQPALQVLKLYSANCKSIKTVSTLTEFFLADLLQLGTLSILANSLTTTTVLRKVVLQKPQSVFRKELWAVVVCHSLIKLTVFQS